MRGWAACIPGAAIIITTSPAPARTQPLPSTPSTPFTPPPLQAAVYLYDRVTAALLPAAWLTRHSRNTM